MSERGLRKIARSGTQFTIAVPVDVSEGWIEKGATHVRVYREGDDLRLVPVRMESQVTRLDGTVEGPHE